MTQTNKLNSAELDNALVGQKNAILALLNTTEDADGFHDLLDMVELLKPVWLATGYGYKLAEVCDRIATSVCFFRGNARESLEHRENARRPAYRRLLNAELDGLDGVMNRLAVVKMGS